MWVIWRYNISIEYKGGYQMAVSLVKDYKKLLNRKMQIESELSNLPRGYISKKTIRGKKYFYLQTRTSGTFTSRYLKREETDTVIKQISLRKQYESELPKIKIRLEELEQASRLLDKDLSRELMLLKITAGMDSIDSAQRERSVSFASAMNAIEGIPISNQTEQDISNWKLGNKSFLTIFKFTLRRYGFVSKVK
jgi:hypothetical protein